MSTLRQSLRLTMARTLLRGASWLDRLAVRLLKPAPVASSAVSPAEDTPAGDLLTTQPPAHWLRRVRRQPPAHWLARIRQQAPHLLDGDALAGAGWTRMTVPSDLALPAVDVPPTAGAELPPQTSGTGSPPAPVRPALPVRRITPLFLGRALRLQRAAPPGLGAEVPHPQRPESQSTTQTVPPDGALRTSPTGSVPVSTGQRVTLSAETPGTGPTKPSPGAPNWDLRHLAAAPNLETAGPSPDANTPAPAGTPRASQPETAVPARATPPAAARDAVSTPPDLGSPSSVHTPDAQVPAANPRAFMPQSADHHAAALQPGLGYVPAWPDQGATRRGVPSRVARATGTSPANTPDSGPAAASVVPDWPAVPTAHWDVVSQAPNQNLVLPWPALPEWPAPDEPEPHQDPQTWQHRQRLDREQRGLLWNE